MLRFKIECESCESITIVEEVDLDQDPKFCPVCGSEGNVTEHDEEFD